MTNKIELLQMVLRKHRPDLSEEYITLLSKRLTKIEVSGKEIYDALDQMNEEEKVLYLGSLVEAEHIRQHMSYLANRPKEVGSYYY